jgi:hypothetical protein
MDFIGSDINHVAGFQRTGLVAFVNFAFSGENVDFVFVGMIMARCVAARLNFELAHGEVGSAIVGIDEPANGAAA